MKIRKSSIAVIMASLIAIGCGIGGTIAWLTDQPTAVVNTFTVGNIDIELFEHKYDADTNTLLTAEVTENTNYKMVPGTVLPKDPFVRVKAGSEACYLFVKITETCGVQKAGTDPAEYYTFDDFITYVVDEDATVGWEKYTPSTTPAEGVSYFYREVDALTAEGTTDQVFYMIGNKGVDGNAAFTKNEILVNESVTKTEMDALGMNSSKYPKLTFEACAVQKANIADVDTAFAETGWETSGN